MSTEEEIEIKEQINTPININNAEDRIPLIKKLNNVRVYGASDQVSLMLEDTFWNGHRLVITNTFCDEYESSVDLIDLLIWLEDNNICKINYKSVL